MTSSTITAVNDNERMDSTHPRADAPQNHDVVVTIRNIARRGRHTCSLTELDTTPASGHTSGLVGRDRVHHPGPVDAPLDALHPYSWQPKQLCRIVRHGPRFPSSA